MTLRKKKTVRKKATRPMARTIYSDGAQPRATPPPSKEPVPEPPAPTFAPGLPPDGLGPKAMRRWQDAERQRRERWEREHG